ncbi:MAG: ThiF family adenylyltransferase, partial [Gemmataceae bacterium]|nr:ThiF family adenylyltransferase [Gemmataceae bacterium]
MQTTDPLERYSRQMRLPGIGKAGQERLLASRVTLCGCGALGTVLANALVRAGVGFVRIVDRDFVEPSNLQRQVLFDETDIAENLPKAEAAARKLRQINSTVTIEPIVADINRSNIEDLCHDVDLILDGSDNFELRYLINDLAIK